ncbi:superoxide dismutase[Cu-Zn] [Mycobacterium bourgelatii]|uniref:Superoxide dismutase [Cu-Zn] n=1 Tax=Mycobacterium bourgelatii TaxID=1273442 RepID=A0A7I9YHW4_MYCBU|nr:superoxide dismutase family protein [Mycobacterium bourgelatii]MCV6973316.1 superoxide dismutase family protein [Mycobacterium bourgelatii]GFG88258.1 superoxide dismutase [Cu-Zn] [Mycobacterium bourgelatii]
MPKPAGHRNAAAVSLSVLAAATSVALLSACSSPQKAAPQSEQSQNTVPPIWTPSPAPSTTGHGDGHTQAPAGPASETLTTVLKGPDGVEVATAKFEFANGYATITLQTTTAGILSPGFHGVHLHQVGKCEGDFSSAGGHFHSDGHGSHAGGDLTSLQVRKDGSGLLVTTTDAFTKEELVSGDKTAIIIHSGADNFGNIPADRYTQTNGTPGPDETTTTTGDAGKRVACGVIGSG